MSNFFDKLRVANHPVPQKATMDGDEAVELDALSSYERADTRLSVASAAMVWAETSEDDLDEDETLADRLDSLLVGIVDQNKDGELSDDELNALDVAYSTLADYLGTKGVSEDDIDALLNDGDADAAERVSELLVGVLPNGEDAEISDLHGFAFDADSDASVMDAAFKKVVAIRGGKKMRVRKRISGHVRLTSKQKIGIQKMLRKSHSGAAKAHRAKSMRLRKSMGI